MFICKKCGSTRIKKDGFRPNGEQKYRCSPCGCRRLDYIEDDDEDDCVIDSIQQEIPHISSRVEFDDSDDLSHEELINKCGDLIKVRQRLMDTSRIERATHRGRMRVENALEEYTKAIRDIVSRKSIPPIPYIGTTTGNHVGIVHLTDIHFNELVDILGNQYDFRIASRRLYLLAMKVLDYVDAKNISKLYVCMTGDLMNSDRRIDELLSLATNRAGATFLAAKILSQFVSVLAQYVNEVNIVSVTGNESRIKDEYSFHDTLLTDNFDFMIYEVMKLYFQNNDRVNFLYGRGFEYVMDIHGTHFLLVHGNNLGKMSTDNISRAKAKWGSKGVKIDYIMCGHLHETNITDSLLRSGSLVGNNSYADVALNLNGRASQNMYIVDSSGNVDAIKIDLQHTLNEHDVFDVDEDLMYYNAKSIEKIKKQIPILKVVV